LRSALHAAAPSAVCAGALGAEPDGLADGAVVLDDEVASDADALGALVAAWPGLRIVHLARHPFAALAELRGTLDQRAAEEAWRTANGNLLDLAEQLGPERVRMVRVEDLVESGDDPIATLLGVVGVEPLADGDARAPVLDARRLDGWRDAALDERPGRALRSIADELGYDTTWPVPEVVPARGSGA
jgi:hypothetical protein